MVPYSRARLVATAGLMAALTACFQLAAAFLPGPGHALSAMGTLPIALLACISPAAGLAALLTGSVLVSMISPAEAPILLLMTGPLGLALGWAKNRLFPRWLQVLWAGLILAAGMSLLTYLVGMPAFGNLLAGWGPWLVLAFYLCFAFVYTWLWTFFLQAFHFKL